MFNRALAAIRHHLVAWLWQLYRLRDGRAVRIEIYKEQREALKAVGLQE
jgi:hypothetical protein